MRPRLWIVPRNDLEATEIIRLLENAGEQVVVSQQAWGASWENLEPHVAAAVEAILTESLETEPIGIELIGEPRWNGRNIDHHGYAEGDRSNEQSSIEQVAELIGHELNRYERLVAANDKGWYPALFAAGATAGEAETIRMADRCAQGVTPDQEAQAIRDIAAAEWRGRNVLINCPRGSSSAVMDRLYSRYNEALTAAPDKWIYFGYRAREIRELIKQAGLGHLRDWVGGSPKSGYAGFVEPSAEAQRLITTFFWQD